MESKVTHFLYTPFTGLGLYNGHRGTRWLRNRIKIFKQFVVPSLLAQTDKDFVLWISWRQEDRGCKDINALETYLLSLNIRTVFTYNGVCFYDDKYPEDIARDRLAHALHGSMGPLINEMSGETVLMTIQPSDDCYHSLMVEETKAFFALHPDQDVFGYKKGYVMDYTTGRIAEWNPSTTPPFYTIKFEKKIFIEPNKHATFTGPYPSHEYVKDYMKATYIDTRGFTVGTHGENISTVFDHPFTGAEVARETLSRFGIANVPLLKLHMSIRKTLMRKLPHGWQRKLRYWFGERFYSKIYAWLRN